MTEPSNFDGADVDPTDEMLADELASAFIDGEATDEEIAAIEGDPALAERVAQLRSVASATAETVTPPPAEVRSAHLAAAMAAFDSTFDTDVVANAGATFTAIDPPSDTIDITSPDSGAAASSTDAPVVDLRDRRTARAERGNRWLMSVAAAVLVVAGIGFASTRLGSNGDDETAFASDSATETTTAAASNAAGATEALEAEALSGDDSDAMEESAADFDVDEAMEDDEEAMEDEAMEEEAMEDDTAMADSDAGADDSGESTEADIAARQPLLVADPLASLTIDQLVAESGDASILPLEESACAADLLVENGGWFSVQLADGQLTELIIEITDDGEEIGRLVDADCVTILE